MKFIGQYIQQFIARFRADVYLEGVTESAQDHIVGIDADGKLYKQDVPVGDITGVTAGDALTGGGTSGTVTINHEDTSSQASVNNSGRTYIQDITLDTYGHVTGLTSATETVTDTNTNQLTEFTLTGDSGSNQTIAHGNTLDVAGGNAISTVVGATDTVTINHDDTSSQASVDNSGSTFIQDVTLDTYGHVTGLTSTAVPTLNQDTTGQAGTVATIAGLAPNTATTAAAQPNITSLGTLTGLTVGGTSTFIGEDFRIISNVASHPTVLIGSDTNDATSGEIVFHNARNNASVDGDVCGNIHFKAPNHDGSDPNIIYSSIIGSIAESNDTDEAGKLTFSVAASDGSTSNSRIGMSMTGNGINDTVFVSIGYGASGLISLDSYTRAAAGMQVYQDFVAEQRKFSKSGGTDGDHDGDIVYFGSTTGMTTGRIYFYDSTDEWYPTDADSVNKSGPLLIGVALGSASDTDGVLLRGMVTLNHDPGAVGDILYLATAGGVGANTGMASSTAPSGNGDIIRIIGYCLDASNGQIWFNPDNTFVEYTT